MIFFSNMNIISGQYTTLVNQLHIVLKLSIFLVKIK